MNGQEATVTINGKEHNVGIQMLGIEEVVQMAVGGLPSADAVYAVEYKRKDLTTRHRLLPSERMTAENGMEFTVYLK